MSCKASRKQRCRSRHRNRNSCVATGILQFLTMHEGLDVTEEIKQDKGTHEFSQEDVLERVKRNPIIIGSEFDVWSYFLCVEGGFVDFLTIYPSNCFRG